MTADSERNADYMHKAAIKSIRVEKNALQWTIEGVDIREKYNLP